MEADQARYEIIEKQSELMGKVVQQMREEIKAMEGERDKLAKAVQDRKRDQEKQVEHIKSENVSLKDIVQQLNLENTRMTEEKTGKDH